MRITLKQLKQLIHETIEDIDPMDLERQAKNGDDLEKLTKRIGMGRVMESIKKTVRNAIKEELKGDQDELDVAPPFGKLTGDDFEKLGEKSKKKAKEED